MDKKSMLDAMIAHYTGGNKAKFATLLGVSAQTISAWGVRNTFDSELIYTKCIGLSSEWLLTGEGPMLRDSKTSEESKLGVTPNATPISPAEESIIYKMYKDEKEEKERLVKEKETKIDQLQSELRSMEKELAVLKAQHPETSIPHPEVLNPAKNASTKKPSLPPNVGSAPSATAHSE